MKYSLFLFLFVFYLLCLAFKPSHFFNIPIKAQNAKQSKFIIDILPFDDISNDKVMYVYNAISKICPNIELKKPITLPKSAFYKPRNRYRADSLIDYLERITPAGHVVLGITSKDISCTNDKIPDWGVMGLSYCPGRSCVVSTFRLDKNNLLEQLFKTSIHELGHTMGLDHCPEKTCLMRDAKGKNTTNEEKEFCKKCKLFLKNKGWILN